ncbi:MAG TPA: hypothetical protein K8V48_06445 [Limosilactobacillus oris]|uniref:hypothetical protein n=1 Tax=Limosilactobacillus oris TaxID=1632 RepID=UPI001D2905F1|nr:hypothetical protein [Limosilactobacillus oris]HJF47594.1 hypothetical protein [Limosilactobacillus oris]
MNLVEYYNSNITAIYQRVIALYNKGQPAYEADVATPKLELIPVPKPGDKLNRAVYLWTIDCIKQLEAVVNALIDVYNDNGVIDYDVGDTPDVDLWLPERLAIDDLYIAKLSDDFEACNKALDGLDKNLQPFLAGV